MTSIRFLSLTVILGLAALQWAQEEKPPRKICQLFWGGSAVCSDPEEFIWHACEDVDGRNLLLLTVKAREFVPDLQMFLRWIDPDTRLEERSVQLVEQLVSGSGDYSGLQTLPKRRQIILWSDRRGIGLHDLRGNLVLKIGRPEFGGNKLLPREIRCIDVDATEKLLIVGDRVGRIAAINLENSELVWEHKGNDTRVFAPRLCPRCLENLPDYHDDFCLRVINSSRVVGLHRLGPIRGMFVCYDITNGEIIAQNRHFVTTRLFVLGQNSGYILAADDNWYPFGCRQPMLGGKREQQPGITSPKGEVLRILTPQFELARELLFLEGLKGNVSTSDAYLAWAEDAGLIALRRNITLLIDKDKSYSDILLYRIRDQKIAQLAILPGTSGRDQLFFFRGGEYLAVKDRHTMNLYIWRIDRIPEKAYMSIREFAKSNVRTQPVIKPPIVNAIRFPFCP